MPHLPPKEVQDTGIGIREEDLPKLSAEFERIEEDRNRNIEGTGLGMNITIQLLAFSRFRNTLRFTALSSTTSTLASGAQNLVS